MLLTVAQYVLVDGIKTEFSKKNQSAEQEENDSEDTEDSETELDLDDLKDFMAYNHSIIWYSATHPDLMARHSYSIYNSFCPSDLTPPPKI